MSNESLNDSFDWNEDYLKEIQTSLLKESISYKYLLQSNQENSNKANFKVYRKLDKNKNDRILYFNVGLEKCQSSNPI